MIIAIINMTIVIINRIIAIISRIRAIISWIIAIMSWIIASISKTIAIIGRIIPQTDLSVGVLTVLIRGLQWSVSAFQLPGSSNPSNLHYLVTPTLKNT